MSYIVGLDVGQAADYTALAVLQIGADELSVRHLIRYSLQTPYPQIVDAVAKLCQSPELANAPIVTDQTGVGRPIVDMLRLQTGIGPIVPVTITAARAVRRADDGGYLVPKRELVLCLQAALNSRQLKVASSLPSAAEFVRELGAFEVRITDGDYETFGAWRYGAHDDMVLAVALAVWYARENA